MLTGVIDNRAHKIGSITVFTYEGAIGAYRLFASRCYAEATMEASAILTDVMQQMMTLGFSPNYLEQIEIEELAKVKGQKEVIQ